jgi:hypothetical protein
MSEGRGHMPRGRSMGRARGNPQSGDARAPQQPTGRGGRGPRPPQQQQQPQQQLPSRPPVIPTIFTTLSNLIFATQSHTLIKYYLISPVKQSPLITV